MGAFDLLSDDDPRVIAHEAKKLATSTTPYHWSVELTD